jgi:hypothetical protein
MKTLQAFVIVLLSFPVLAIPEGDTTKIYEHAGRDGVLYEWHLSAQQFRDAPRWDPSKGEPPLTISNAVATASKWIKNRWPNIAKGRFRLRSISIEGGPRVESGPLINFFYYKVVFRVGDFDHRAAILFMDGSPLEPRAAGLIGDEVERGKIAPKARSSGND